jgi:signal transduction histidine kinase
MRQSGVHPSIEYSPDTDLHVKSVHLVYFRMAFALCSLVVGAVVVWVGGGGGEQHPIGVFATAAGVVAYSSLALVAIKFARPDQHRLLRGYNAVLLTMDILSLSALVHFDKGIDSDLYFLYLLPIVLASHTFGRFGIFATAIGASVAYGATLIIENLSFLPYLFGNREGLTVAYSQRLWARIFTREAMLVGVSFIWALFCEHMSRVAQQGATRLRGQLDANNMLMAETRAQAAREQLINSLSASIRSTLDIDRILSTTVAHLINALGANRCAIITQSEHHGDAPTIWQACDQDDDHGNHSKSSCPVEATYSPAFCQFALDNLAHYIELPSGELKKTFVYNAPLQQDAFALIKPELEKLEVQSMIAQPIMYGNDSKGVLLIAETEHQRDWTFSEIEMVKAVAGQVAIAIEHGRLVDQLSRKNRDLLQKNLHLDAKNLELRTVQSQLIHQEKMASLGRMVAGIAHELNNPVNFVHGNVPYLREYFEDLKKLVDSIETIPAEYRANTDAIKKSLKYDFLVTDLDNIIADLGEGAERIRQIIRNLRSFSRLDEAELKEASIQEGIESTIKILNQYYGRDKIPVDTSFADIPAVTCYPGKLNQVWMNLLSNAAQAVSDKPDPMVRVKTELEGEWVTVSISDNGTGIKSTDQSKIFEPFYTTKPVGQGTGLGLSICHSIIERHGGNIWFETALGEGTTFKVKIPLKAEIEEREEAVQQMALSHE